MATATYERVLRIPRLAELDTSRQYKDVKLHIQQKMSGGWILRVQFADLDGVVVQYIDKSMKVVSAYVGRIEGNQANGSGIFLRFDVGNTKRETIGLWKDDMMVIGQHESHTRREQGEYCGKYCRGLLIDKRPTTHWKKRLCKGTFMQDWWFRTTSDDVASMLPSVDKCIENSQVEIRNALNLAVTLTLRFETFLRQSRKSSTATRTLKKEKPVLDASLQVRVCF